MDKEIRRKLDQITDILWAGGVTNPVTYIEQISYLIYLKLLDERESEIELQEQLTEEDKENSGNQQRLFPGSAEEYRWSEWRFKSGTELRDFLRDEVFEYMGSLVKEAPKVAQYFRDATLEIQDSSVLKQVVDELDKIEFRKLGTDVKGDIFEYLLTHLGQSALNGQFRTPRQIRLMMVNMVNPDFGDTIYDPACGTGGFLIDAVEYLLAKYSSETNEVPIYGEDWLEQKNVTIEEAKEEYPSLQTYQRGSGEKIPDWDMLEQSIYGIDVSRQMMRISMMNLVLHGIRKANVKRANTLSDLGGGLTDEDIHRQYDVIFSNPPFAGQLPKDSIRSDLPTTSKKSELLFLGVMMESLKPGGRCAVVVPEGLLFGSTNAHESLREKLVNDFHLQAVVSLPAGVFEPYTGVKTAVLVFQRPKTLSENGQAVTPHVWFYEVENDGFDPDKVEDKGRPRTPKKNDIPDLLDTWQEYKETEFSDPPGKETDEVLPAGQGSLNCWWAPLDEIEANGYSLAAGRYKPRVATEAPDEDPKELIRNTLSLEKEIAEELETLLTEVQ
jgi:type I restriction enzyme M protein